MNKTKIEWCDYTINPVKGLCPMACPYCYARATYKRFRWNPEIRFDASVLDDIDKIKVPSRVFVGSTMELFGDWIRPGWSDVLFRAVRRMSQHTFIFLTKQPQNLIKWSPFPDNCWVGVSTTDDAMMVKALDYLRHIQAGIKFISIEPMLAPVYTGWIDVYFKNAGVGWLIIGQQTPISAKTQPKMEWIQEIVEAADKAEIPVFLKDNLRPLLSTEYGFIRLSNAFRNGYLRQEFPNVLRG